MLVRNKTFKVITLTSSIIALLMISGCETSAVKRDPPAPPVAEDFIPKGHIDSPQQMAEQQPDINAIPGISTASTAKLPPLDLTQKELYSITAIKVPVTELLFQISQDSAKEIDISNGVEGTVTINAINQPLEQILDRMSEQANFVFEMRDNVIKIRPDVPEWRNYKVDYVNITKTSTDSIDMKMNVSSSVDGASSTLGKGSSSQVKVESKHDFWVQLDNNIQKLAQLDPYSISEVVAETEKDKKGGSQKVSQNTVVNPEAGVISVFTTDKKHRAIKKYIEQVTQRAEKQVLIEATVVEVTLNDQYQAGIDWSMINSSAFGSSGGISFSSPFSGPSDGFSIGTVNPLGAAGSVASGDWNILANLKLLKQFGDSKVLSSPKIMAINNQTALLKVVNNLVYFTVDVNTTTGTQTSQTTYETEVQTVPVGFTMSVTPFVSDEGTVTLNVRPTLSRLIGQVADPNPALVNSGVESLIPIIQEKEMSSVLRLQDRQVAIIGGLIEDENSNNRNGIPWLSDTPYVGDLFSARDDQATKSELVIFIRPIIIDNPDVYNGDLRSVSQFLKTQSM
ncbi:pilus (MSHA type) biogenesis protein MshL [Thiomicrorhabdus sp. 6S3-12]|uniref:pilus (MSHA type) biogenesis protein MshL n=1 Tax=Thiomicrorhabdus sp. 6S3-12 TaxID=2819681 RepID=UPI001AACF10D|nr:pilus (MSHA type) biogenesis protein MshL [Thiomicrorhabdus sp. 6S3-12]MBO1923725.1 pilus (MSHA type) biogenesis protein MshL [Thiomicrorhabdus sp. 6S3-12]